MLTLNIASKANQASTLPAILVAHYAQECDRSLSIKVNYEDVDTLKSTDKATVEFTRGDSTTIYGCKEVIGELMSTHSSLQAKNENTVSAIFEDY